MGNTEQLYGSLANCMNEQGSCFSDDPCEDVQTWSNPVIKCCCESLFERRTGRPMLLGLQSSSALGGAPSRLLR